MLSTRATASSAVTFVADADGYVRTPAELPAGEIMLTLTYTGADPAPHSLVIEGLNGDQPVVAVDLPGSNNGSVVIPAGGYVFYDGAPGNRAAGFEGRVQVVESELPSSPVEPEATASWSTTGLAFTSSPRVAAPASVPIALHLTVTDALPHSIGLERVRGEQPLVAVDGPGTNQRTISLPPGATPFSAQSQVIARRAWKDYSMSGESRRRSHQHGLSRFRCLLPRVARRVR